MIDFTDCKGLVNSYEGADFKRKIIYDGDVYMLKFGQKLEPAAPSTAAAIPIAVTPSSSLTALPVETWRSRESTGRAMPLGSPRG